MPEIENRQAQNLCYLLRNEHLSGKKFAEKIGTIEPTVSRWKHGKNRISAEYAQKINEHFPDYSIDFILGNSDYPNEKCKRLEERNERIRNSHLMIDCIDGLLQLNGIEKRDGATIPIYDEQGEIADYTIEHVVSKDGRSVTVTDEQWASFEVEVLEYVGFRIDQLLERGCW